MRWFLLLLVVLGMGEYVPVSDGAASVEDIPATYTANRVVGDIYPQGADAPFQRLVNTRGGGFLTTNSDPSAVGVDPLTGAPSPVGTDVGFAAPIRRFIQTGVLNGDFSQGPSDADMPISDDNPLPFWVVANASPFNVLTYAAAATFASGYCIKGRGTVGGATTDIVQWVPVVASQGQQYRVILSAYMGSGWSMRYQFYEIDATTAIGSELVTSTPIYFETKADLGLVPTNGAWLKLTARYTGSSLASLGEVRVVFLPVEQPVGLAVNTNSVGAFSTTETRVIGITVPANSLTVGSVYRIWAPATLSSSAANVCTFRIRVGTTTLTGTVAVSMNPTATTTASSDDFILEGTVVVVTTGAVGSLLGHLQMVARTTQPFAVGHRVEVATASIAVDTTVANVIELTGQAAAGTTTMTFRAGAYIQCVMAS